MHVRLRPDRDARQAVCGIGAPAPAPARVHVVGIHGLRRRKCRRGLHSKRIRGDMSQSYLHRRRRCGDDRFAPCVCAVSYDSAYRLDDSAYRFDDSAYGFDNPAGVEQQRSHHAQLCTRRSRRMLHRCSTTRCRRGAVWGGLPDCAGGHAREAPRSIGVTMQPFRAKSSARLRLTFDLRRPQVIQAHTLRGSGLEAPFSREMSSKNPSKDPNRWSIFRSDAGRQGLRDARMLRAIREGKANLNRPP